MKIRPVETELFLADRQTDMMKLIVTFRNFANAPVNNNTFYVTVRCSLCIAINTFTAIVDLIRSNFSIARTPLFQLKSAM